MLARSASSTWLADIGVIGTLLLWHVIGAISSRRRLQPDHRAGRPADAGYVANYYRYFGATEAPFDWYQSVLAQLAAVSTAGVWMRLPATLAAIGTWLILSRCVLPRLGRRLAANRVAVWTAGAVFLAAWLPFNNGLRPEPLIAFGALAVWMLVENAIATRRLWPAAVRHRRRGVHRDAGAAGTDRAGAAAGRRPRHRRASIRQRRATDGLLAPLAPLAAAAVADLRRRVPRPDAGHRRRVGPHQVHRRPDHRLVPGVPALLLPDRRGQRRRLADPALRRAGAAAVPVRHAGGAAAARPGARAWPAARCGG